MKMRVKEEKEECLNGKASITNVNLAKDAKNVVIVKGQSFRDRFLLFLKKLVNDVLC